MMKAERLRIAGGWATTRENHGTQGGQANERAYDFEERTARFGEAVIAFARRLPKDLVTLPLIGQIVRAGTSVGADYCEADDALSRKDFRHRIGICRKEARESKPWFRMLASAAPDAKQEARFLWQEAKELPLIFAAIWGRRRQS